MHKLTVCFVFQFLFFIRLNFFCKTAPHCVFCVFTYICHSLPAWCQSSCSHQCCCWQTFLWHSWRWIPAEFEFGSGSRQSQHGRASECRCRNTPGPYSRSQWTGSSKESMAGLESKNKELHYLKKKKKWFLSALWLTVRITYTQLGRILHIFYDSGPFNFPRLTFAVLFQIYFMLDYGKCSQCKYHISSLWLHICTKKL